MGRAMPQKLLPVYHHGGRGQLSSAGPETRADVSVVRDGQAGLELREWPLTPTTRDLGPLSAADLSSQGMAIRVELTTCLKVLCVWLSIGMAA